MKLSFGDPNDKEQSIEDQSVKVAEAPASPAAWEVPDPDERILDIARDEFRIHFNPQTWAGRISSAEVLSTGQMSSLDSFKQSPGADYCVWLPGPSAVLSEPAAYSVSAHDQDGQSSSSISFAMKTSSGQPLGTLQCFFPRAPSAAGVAFNRWTTIAGRHLTLEVRP